MSELFSKFSNMINEGNIPDEMKNILSSMQNGNKEETTDGEHNDSPSIDFETIMKMKQIMEKMKGTEKDPRATLLLSLKPYLKESRKDKVDQYIKLFSMGKAMEIFGNLRRWNKKIMEYSPFYRKSYYNNYYASNRRGIQRKPILPKEPPANVGATSSRPNSEEFTQRHIKPSESSKKENKPIFEIFGIKLYFDDLLIIALLFFLYEEGVEDNLLFISLVLLLLS